MPHQHDIFVFINDYRKQYFFSNDYCQKGPREDGFVEVAFTMPHDVAPRPWLPDGIVHTKEDLIKVYFENYTEIDNPDPTLAHGEWMVSDTTNTYTRDGHTFYYILYRAPTEEAAMEWLAKRPPAKLAAGDYSIDGPKEE